MLKAVRLVYFRLEFITLQLVALGILFRRDVPAFLYIPKLKSGQTQK